MDIFFYGAFLRREDVVARRIFELKFQVYSAEKEIKMTENWSLN